MFAAYPDLFENNNYDVSVMLIDRLESGTLHLYYLFTVGQHNVTKCPLNNLFFYSNYDVSLMS